MPDDLHTRLVAALTARLERARAWREDRRDWAYVGQRRCDEQGRAVRWRSMRLVETIDVEVDHG